MTLKTLIIKNLVLVEEAHLSFKEGLTVITGETGAGKTALIEAIRLILGKRSDATKVRKGCEKATIQAAFDPSFTPELRDLLNEAGLSILEDEELILTREISAQGKSRAFICSQLVPSSFLTSLAPHLIDFVGQNAQVDMRAAEVQRKYLDLFADIDLIPFQMCLIREKEFEAQTRRLREEKKESGAKRPFLKSQLEELASLQLKEDEEKTLFEEYSFLSNAQELLASTEKALEQTDSLIEGCGKVGSLIKQMQKYEETFVDAEEMTKEAHLQLSELRALTLSFQGKLENDPHRLIFLEERLSKIDQLK